MTGFSGFAKGITPAETNSLIGEPVFSLEDLKNGFKQSFWENMDKVLKVKQLLSPLSNLRYKQGTGFLITPPEILIEQEEKKKFKEPYPSLEVENDHRVW